jgi:PIN domain nuclease of toxin-antitoxin system
VQPRHEFYLSIASTWEMQIKAQLGKLALSVPIVQMVDRNERVNGIQILPITLGDIGELENLPAHHKDPFDRIMIAQPIRGNLSIISVDQVFSDYPVAVIW